MPATKSFLECSLSLANWSCTDADSERGIPHHLDQHATHLERLRSRTNCRVRLRRHAGAAPLTIATLMSDIGKEWTLNASLTRLSSYRKCSKRRISGHSAQATSLLPIDGTTKCSRIARGFGFGSGTGFAAGVNPKAGLGFRASAAFPFRNR